MHKVNAVLLAGFFAAALASPAYAASLSELLDKQCTSAASQGLIKKDSAQLQLLNIGSPLVYSSSSLDNKDGKVTSTVALYVECTASTDGTAFTGSTPVIVQLDTLWSKDGEKLDEHQTTKPAYSVWPEDKVDDAFREAINF